MVNDLVPDDFLEFIENWELYGAEANDTITSIDKIATDNGVDTMRIIVGTPWPLSDRILFDTRYCELNQDGCHMMLLSSSGNEHLISDKAIFSDKDRKDNALAFSHLIGCWVKPVKDENSGDVIGTHLLYFSQVQAGGNIPTFVQNKLGPLTALNSIKGSITWARNNKKRDK